MTARFQRAGQIEPHRFRVPGEVLPFRHAPRAIDPHPGEVVTALGDEGIAMSGFDVAERGQGLLEHQRKAGERVGEN